jgi:O-acetyl-ADP-ribose deacetylase (regulator of RNase III)/uncharacterized protein YwgA
MFKALIGNLFESKAQTLVNTVNCVGVMGKGVAFEFKKRYPQMFEDYASRCEHEEVRLGRPYLYRDPSGTRIVNFPTKSHWRAASRLADIERGLDYFVAHVKEWKITSVVFPPLGCGNGGLEWTEVGPLLYAKLHNLGIEIEVYAPYGTPRSELTNEFLSAPSQMSLGGKGRRNERFNPEWVALVEVVRELAHQPYANPVGRTIFQKVAYVLTELGAETGFQFAKGSYGPFADEVKLALHELANLNWIREEQLGKMTALRPAPHYEEARKKFADVIDRHNKRIAKTVDLFSRIKSTDQAEEVVTVLFASRELKKAKPGIEVTEQDLYDFILNWKKAWRTEGKQREVAGAIRNLVMLGWMKLQFSESLLETA